MQVRLILRDDENRWDKARGIVQEFAANPGVRAVIGYDRDHIAIRASPIYEAARLLHICVNTHNLCNNTAC